MSSQRNLVVMLYDEFQRDCASTYGGPVPTPTMDRLADRGVVFDRYYCANPLCVPTRPSMMGGKWPHAHGSITFGEGYSTINRGEEMIFDRLLDGGYHVGYEGIWHIKRDPADDRTDEFAYYKETGFCREQYKEVLREHGGEDGDQQGPCKYPTDTDIRDARLSIPHPMVWTRPIEEHDDYRHARNIADFILNAPADKAVAAFCSSGIPHPPLLVPQEYMEMFDPAEVKLPESFGEDRSDMPWAVAEAPGYQAVQHFHERRWREAIAAYYAFVAFGDYTQGLVVDALEESGRMDEAVTVMTCDHGEMLGAHSMYQKGCLYEESIALPLVICAPGIEAGRRSQLASQTDFAPTLLELLDLPPLQEAQGGSLVPILQDADHPGRPYTFSEFNGHVDGGVKIRGAISDRYKYIYAHNDGEQLFDLHEDPHEMDDLSDDPDYLTVKEEMRTALAEWMEATGD
ncbi:MAG: sulfatase-like hydrolase/transferase, partial [Armatimonadota bacterium]